jgi:hypothetical protein
MAFGECDAPEISERLRAALSEMLSDPKYAGLPARIVLSDSWARFWMVNPPGNVSSIDDCEIAATARFSALFGEAMSGWQISADYDARQPFLACAIPQWLLLALKQITQDRKIILLDVTPQLVVSWNAWRRQIQAEDWFGVMHGNRLTYAVAGEKGMEAVGSTKLPADAIASQKRLQEILLREALRLNVRMPSKIKLCGEIPSHWVMQKIEALTFERLYRNWTETTATPSSLSLARSGLPS